MSKYSIGIDFGTLSGRAVLINLETGEESAQSVYDYPHGVMDERLPDGAPLPQDYALQHPQDYLDVFARTIPEVLRASRVKPDDVAGVGIDFTACTVLPCAADGTPLCFLPEFENRPHAYVKLWKHHAAQDRADELNAIARERGERWLPRYGGKISSEWVFPKLWEILKEDEMVYRQTERFIEAADWVVWQLTGVESRNSCTAGYKAIYSPKDGFPDGAFFAALDERMENVIGEKFSHRISPLGTRAGGLTRGMAGVTGLLPGTAVAVGNVDAHVCVPAVGIDGPNKLLAIMGTSTCHILMGMRELNIPGICGVVENGVLPGYYGYEAGQSCVGDHFAWFVENCLPNGYAAEAARRGISPYELLSEKAAALRPGQSGLIALDWWNGNRSVLVDADLTGLLLGCTLQTKPEEIYRALIEATAYGTKMIVENFRAGGQPVDEFYAAGGISQKDPLTMQIYADVLDMPIRIAASTQAPALGSAMFGAVAAGEAAGGFASIFEAARKLGRTRREAYYPNPARARVYGELYAAYRELHDHFGRGGSDVMKRLKALRARQSR